MQLLGIEFTNEHARLVMAALGMLAGAGGFLIGRWTKHRAHVKFSREDLVASTAVIELYAVAKGPDGRDMLHIVTQGGPLALERLFSTPELVAAVRRRARRHPGLLKLSNPVAHRMMMDEGKDLITGYDPQANIDFVQGRATRDDEVLMGFAAYAERNHDGTRLHDQIARVVLMVLSPGLIDRLADPGYVERLQVRHSGYRPKCARLHDFALEWRRLQSLPPAERSSATDRIWQVTVRTALR